MDYPKYEFGRCKLNRCVSPLAALKYGPHDGEVRSVKRTFIRKYNVFVVCTQCKAERLMELPQEDIVFNGWEHMVNTKVLYSGPDDY